MTLRFGVYLRHIYSILRLKFKIITLALCITLLQSHQILGVRAESHTFERALYTRSADTKCICICLFTNVYNYHGLYKQRFIGCVMTILRAKSKYTSAQTHILNYSPLVQTSWELGESNQNKFLVFPLSPFCCKLRHKRSTNLSVCNTLP